MTQPGLSGREVLERNIAIARLRLPESNPAAALANTDGRGAEERHQCAHAVSETHEQRERAGALVVAVDTIIPAIVPR